MHINFYVPENLDLPNQIKNFKEIDREKYLWVIHTISNLDHKNQKLDDWVEISREYIRSIIKDSEIKRKIFNSLQEAEIIEVDNNYVSPFLVNLEGSSFKETKCKRYRLSQNFVKSKRDWKIFKNSKLIKNLIEFKTKRLNLSVYKKLENNYSNIRIDIEKVNLLPEVDFTTLTSFAFKIVREKYFSKEMIDICNSYGYYSIDSMIIDKILYAGGFFVEDKNLEEKIMHTCNSLFRIFCNDLSFKISSSGRIYGTLQNLNNKLLQFIIFNNKNIFEVDIPCSQPRFAGYEAMNKYGLTSDIIEYLDYCNGDKSLGKDLYSFLMDYIKFEGTRDEFKIYLFEEFFYCKLSNFKLKNKLHEAFAILFPKIYDYVIESKKGNYKNISFRMQKCEADIIINKVCAELYNEYSDIQFITRHDSIICTDEYKDIVKKKIQDVILREYKHSTNVEIKELNKSILKKYNNKDKDMENTLRKMGFVDYKNFDPLIIAFAKEWFSLINEELNVRICYVMDFEGDKLFYVSDKYGKKVKCFMNEEEDKFLIYVEKKYGIRI